MRLGGVIFAAAGIVLPTAAMAHTGVHYIGHGASFTSGFAHPIMGIDHLIGMLAVGVWAAYLGGRGMFLIPLAFVSMMIVGAGLGALGIVLPAVDPAIAASLVVFGLLICLLVKLPVATAVGVAGLFATFHGYAHGTEIPEMARPLLYSAGFIAATTVLLSLGMAIGSLSRRSLPELVVRGAGVAVAAFGLVTVLGHI